MALLGRLEETDKEGILELVFSCKHPDGSFGPAPGHDSHLLYTLSAVQILALYEELQRVDADAIATYVAGMTADETRTLSCQATVIQAKSCCCTQQLWVLSVMMILSPSCC